VEGSKSIWHRTFRKKEIRLYNKNAIIFAFFLFVAFIFWYISSLGKEVKGEFHFTTDFVNIPKGKAIADEIPLKMTLELKGQGYSLLKYKFYGNENQMEIDLAKISYRRIPESKPSRYYILTSSLIQNIKKQMGNSFEIIAVKPDTIFLISSKE
jgi:hypothetical protein